MGLEEDKDVLVLGIKTDEVIRIDDNIKIIFKKVAEDKLRIAIDAPKEVSILRENTQD